ncbi:MAG: hypothetical protein ACTSQP_20105 [Promethearchaeota archaeon]
MESIVQAHTSLGKRGSNVPVNCIQVLRSPIGKKCPRATGKMYFWRGPR